MITNGNIKKVNSLKERMDISKYKTFGANSVEEYVEKIRGLNLIDLCAHGARYGLNPTLERRKMEKTLVDEFKRAKASYEAACSQSEYSNTLPKDKEERLKKTLDFIRSY